MDHSGVPTLTLRASAPIQPCTFVVLDPANNEAVLPAGANAVPFGVAQAGTRYAPGLATVFGAAESTVAAATGDPVGVYSTGDTCLLLTGGPVAAGDDLESDANGNAVTSTVAGHNVGAKALQAGPAGTYVRARVGRSTH